MTTSRSLRPVSTSTGSFFPRDRISCNTWNPSCPGRPMSRIIRSNSSVIPRRWACSPSSTWRVEKPWARNPFSRNEPTSGSSSAIRILVTFDPFARVPRDDDRERRALAEAALQLDPSAVGLGHRGDDGQAESAPAVPAVGGTAPRGTGGKTGRGRHREGGGGG